MALCVCAGRPVVTERWVEASSKAGGFVEAEGHLLQGGPALRLLPPPLLLFSLALPVQACLLACLNSAPVLARLTLIAASHSPAAAEQPQPLLACPAAASDAAAERKLGFNLLSSLQRAREKPLLEGVWVLISPGG